MNTQMIICMVIFVSTLIGYMLNKIPMWLTAMFSMAALYITGCIDNAGACRFSDCLPDPDGYPRSAYVHGRRRL